MLREAARRRRRQRCARFSRCAAAAGAAGGPANDSPRRGKTKQNKLFHYILLLSGRSSFADSPHAPYDTTAGAWCVWLYLP